MRLIDADKIHPDCMTKDGKLAISQSQLANAPTVPLSDFKDGYKQAIIDGKTNFSRPKGEWIDDTSTNYYCHYYANCNRCGYHIDVHENRGYHNFCPSCGADMRKGAGENETDN